jgi:hypothetical protein
MRVAGWGAGPPLFASTPRGVDLPVEVLDDLELKIMDLARARFAA